MPLQMPHVSVCDSHSSLPQSKHCVLAVLEQGKPIASAEFLISTTSQRIISRLQERNDTRIPQREKTHLSGMSVGPQASFDVVMLPCPLFCLLQFLESGVDVFDRLYSVPAPLSSSVLMLAFCVMLTLLLTY